MHDKAKLCLVFDDGGSTVYTAALPIMRERGIVATAAINSGTIGDGGYLTVAAIAVLQDAGWLIANHTENHIHIPEQTDEVILSEYANCRDWLVSNGYSAGAEYVVFPYNDYDKNTLDIVKEAGCVYACGDTSGPTAGVVAGDMFEETRSSSTLISIATFKERIDSIVANNLYLHLMLHHVRDPAEFGIYSISIADFTEMMDYLKTKVDAGLIDVMNLKEYHEEYSINSRVKIIGSKS